MATRAADIRLHKVKQGGWTVVERHQTRPSCFAGVRGKKKSIWREDRAEREVIYGTLRCILDQPWDDDDSRSGGWQANKSWLTVWEPLPICCSLRVWGMPSVKPLLPLISKDQVFVKMFNAQQGHQYDSPFSIANKSRVNKSSFPRHGYMSTFKITDPDVTRSPGD
ncbi:hypothetical protein K0M31_002026 [Melipona bicolor]|uniref:Uncharacterized protein n=1 Tax=Melipona bicolor TaxID=60889 RepID=A0AA40GGR3_9HYME|nr:hypothetical protein K0M31_002026 [Melipona bicolor]